LEPLDLVTGMVVVGIWVYGNDGEWRMAKFKNCISVGVVIDKDVVHGDQAVGLRG
jgi:hypothetical protein